VRIGKRKAELERICGKGPGLDSRGGRRSHKTQVNPAFSIPYPYPASRIEPPASSFQLLGSDRPLGKTRLRRDAGDRPAPRHLYHMRSRGRSGPDRPACGHERVLYEQLARRAESLRQASQALLVPETVDLGFREAQPWRRSCLTCASWDLRSSLSAAARWWSSRFPASWPATKCGRCWWKSPRGHGLGSSLQAAGGAGFLRQRAACHGAIRASQTSPPNRCRRCCASSTSAAISPTAPRQADVDQMGDRDDRTLVPPGGVKRLYKVFGCLSDHGARRNFIGKKLCSLWEWLRPSQSRLLWRSRLQPR